MTESLKDTINRVCPIGTKRSPFDSRRQARHHAAHGNTLRALIKYLDNVSDADIGVDIDWDPML